MRDYQNIKAFKIADDLVLEIYKLTKDFPKEELYGLISQIRRAAVSVTANIVEGASRKHKRDYLHFLYISRGSLAETGYLLHLSSRLEYLTKDKFCDIDEIRKAAAKTLYGLIISVEKEAKVFSRIIALFTSSLVLYGLKLSKGL